jgi:hypothetical protein
VLFAKRLQPFGHDVDAADDADPSDRCKVLGVAVRHSARAQNKYAHRFILRFESFFWKAVGDRGARVLTAP